MFFVFSRFLVFLAARFSVHRGNAPPPLHSHAVDVIMVQSLQVVPRAAQLVPTMKAQAIANVTHGLGAMVRGSIRSFFLFLCPGVSICHCYATFSVAPFSRLG